MFNAKNLSTLLIFGITFLTITSCKKDKDKSKTDLITSGAWKLVKAEQKTGTAAWVDVTSSYAPCEKDDVIIFNSNATYEANEGGSKCSPSDPQIQDAGSWSFESNETQLKTTSTGSSFPSTVSIDQLDENTFVTTETYTSGGITYYYRTTAGH